MADDTRSASVEGRLLVLLGKALDPTGIALEPLKQAYDLGFADGAATAAVKAATDNAN